MKGLKLNWISVKDKLPENGNLVLIYREDNIKNKFIHDAFYNNNQFEYTDISHYTEKIDNVTYWIYWDHISNPKEDNTCGICKRLNVVHCHRCNALRDENQGYYYYPCNNTWIYLCNLCNGKYTSDVANYRDQWYKENEYKP